MTYLAERLSELRRHLDHLREIRPRVDGREDLGRDLSLHNDASTWTGSWKLSTTSSRSSSSSRPSGR
jgi:hypothetical protein